MVKRVVLSVNQDDFLMPESFIGIEDPTILNAAFEEARLKSSATNDQISKLLGRR